MLDGIRHTAIVFPFQYKDVNSNIDYMTSASQKKKQVGYVELYPRQCFF